jgi:glycosyltransferase involved in cell wall biosynthesis
MDAPLVSVVMPTHNYGRYIGRAIEGILSQTYDRFEVIVVDDASTDDTAEVVGRYEDDRIVFLRREECGCSGVLARNDGMAVAKGDLVAVADADDISVRQRLALQVEFLGRNPEVDVLGGGMIPIDEGGRPLGGPTFMPVFVRPEDYRRRLLVGGNAVLHGTAVFRRRVLEKLRGYQDCVSSGDFEFLLRASRYFQLYNLRKILIYRRRHGASLTRTAGRLLRRHYHRIFTIREYLWVQEEARRLGREQE